MSLVRLEVDAGVALLTLDDPDHRNAITLPMVDEIVAAMDAAEARAEVGAVVVTGAGRAFCAGADMDVLATGDPAAYKRIYEGFLRIARSPLPTLAAVNGAAAGAGMNLALCCDVRIVGPRARFIARFLELGLHPGGGHTWMLERAIGLERATAMVIFGEELRGAEAVEWGLATRCVDEDALVAEALRMAGRAAAIDRPLLERAKATLRQARSIDLHDDAVAVESEVQAWSAQQGFFHERLAALRARIEGGRS